MDAHGTIYIVANGIPATNVDKKRLFLYGVSFFFILAACSRSALHLYNSQKLPLRQTVFLFHIAPVFHPFTKIGNFENTTDETVVYVEHENGGYVLQNMDTLLTEISRSRLMDIAIFASTVYMPRREYFGDLEAALSTLQFLFCKNNPEAINIVIQSRNHNDAVIYERSTSCRKNS